MKSMPAIGIYSISIGEISQISIKATKRYPSPDVYFRSVDRRLKLFSVTWTTADIFECVKCSWLESDISTKITAPFKCPRCALEGIKSDLKNYPNHLLTCGKCQFVGKKVGGAIVQALI